ncbi:MAG: AEC family transporter [Alphaproteobacteria bacterium]|nr:MAG: AEC family transporter [Alphaproteobacteria bacterium]
MSLALTVASVTAPVFLLAATGWAWARLGLDYPVDFITRFAMTLAIPALIFTALLRAPLAPAALASVAGATLAAYLLLAALAALGLRLAGLPLRVWLAPLVFGNTGNLGLPLALFAFGEEGMALAVVIFAVMAVLFATFGLWAVSGSRSPAPALREPMLWATLAGVAAGAAGLSLPLWLGRAIELLGQPAIPLMLITLGVAVARLEVRGFARALIASVLRYLLALGVGLAVGAAFGLPEVARAVLVLQLTTPVAVSSYLVAERFGAEPATVAGLTVVSTLLALASIPLTLALLLPG